MSNFRMVIVVLATSAVSLPAHAGDQETKHFACDFNIGISWTYEAGKYQSVPAKDLSFEIGDVDLDKQSATLILGGKSANSLKIVRALNANTFLEVVNEGFLNVTTIYDRDPATGKYPAVHSRHFGLFGQPVFAQYAGICTAKP